MDYFAAFTISASGMAVEKTRLDITTLKRATEIAKTQLDTVVFNMSVPPAIV